MGKKKDGYDRTLERLQQILVETQAWVIAQGIRPLIVFEGRDSAGKDGAIKRITEYAAPRQTRVVALPKPTERSWYNRAGVEPVMGFCSPGQYENFLKDAPHFERMLTDDGIVLIKLWLDISKQEQAKRLEERINDPLKRFKVSPLDKEAQARWEAYSQARDRMLSETHAHGAGWTVVATDDKKTARLNIIRHILRSLGGPGTRAERPDTDVVFPADGAEGRLAP